MEFNSPSSDGHHHGRISFVVKAATFGAAASFGMGSALSAMQDVHVDRSEGPSLDIVISDEPKMLMKKGAVSRVRQTVQQYQSSTANPKDSSHAESPASLRISYGKTDKTQAGPPSSPKRILYPIPPPESKMWEDETNGSSPCGSCTASMLHSGKPHGTLKQTQAGLPSSPKQEIIYAIQPSESQMWEDEINKSSLPQDAKESLKKYIAIATMGFAEENTEIRVDNKVLKCINHLETIFQTLSESGIGRWREKAATDGKDFWNILTHKLQPVFKCDLWIELLKDKKANGKEELDIFKELEDFNEGMKSIKRLRCKTGRLWEQMVSPKIASPVKDISPVEVMTVPSTYSTSNISVESVKMLCRCPNAGGITTACSMVQTVPKGTVLSSRETLSDQDGPLSTRTEV